MENKFKKDIQYYKFCLYGFFKNLRFFEPFLYLFFLEKGITFLEIGVLIAVREILANIFEIPSGVFADSLGRKKTLISSFLFYITSFVIFYFSSHYYFFILAMVFYAFGDAFRTGTHKAMIFEYLRRNKWDNQRAHYYGHTRSWSQMGSAISSLIAALIVFYTGNYTTIFLFATIPYVLDLILLITYPNYLDSEHKNVNIKQIGKNFIRISKDLLYSFKNKNILKAIGNLSVYSGLIKSTKDYLQPIIYSFALSIPIFISITEKQKSALILGILYFILYLINSFASKNSGKIKDLINSNQKALNITLYIGLTSTLLSGIFYHYSLFILTIVFYMLINLIENLRNPIGVAFVSEHYKDNILASALSANSQTKSFIAAIIAPIIGFFADKFGIGISLSIIALILFIILPLIHLKHKN